MSATAPKKTVPCISVPVESISCHNGPSRAWMHRARREIIEKAEQNLDAIEFCYMRLTTGASSCQFERRVEIFSVVFDDEDEDCVEISFYVLGHFWTGSYNMRTRQGQFYC